MTIQKKKPILKTNEEHKEHDPMNSNFKFQISQPNLQNNAYSHQQISVALKKHHLQT